MVAYAVDKSSPCPLSRHMEPVVEGTIGRDDKKDIHAFSSFDVKIFYINVRLNFGKCNA